MKTRWLMMSSAFFMALLGVALSFLPQEILVQAGVEATTLSVLAVQAGGALYLGFAILNWSAKGVLIGGIYSRPLALGNALHFFMLAVALVKIQLSDVSAELLVVTVPYVVFAAWFGRVLFRPPVDD